MRRYLEKARRVVEWLRVGSCSIRDDRALRSFREDPSKTWLVSYPRTGSHMLRLTAELYFGRPLLPRTFYHPLSEDFLLRHTHDEDLSVTASRVIYLYREPIATVFSELRYRHGASWPEPSVREVADEYARHLSRWLLREEFTRQKTRLTYGGIVRDPLRAVERLCEHFGEPFVETRARRAWKRVTREEVHRKTRHDRRVVGEKGPDYGRARAEFRERRAERVRETMLAVDPRLSSVFDRTGRDDG